MNGEWGPWTEDFDCNAACESQGVQGEVRTCLNVQSGGEECTREDQTKTTLGNRVETRMTTCENTEACPGWKHIVNNPDTSCYFPFNVLFR